MVHAITIKIICFFIGECYAGLEFFVKPAVSKSRELWYNRGMEPDIECKLEGSMKEMTEEEAFALTNTIPKIRQKLTLQKLAFVFQWYA